MSQLTIKLSDKADALIAQLQKEIFNRRRKKVSPAGVVETLVESGAKSQSDKRFATSWTNLIADIEKAAKVANAHGSKPASLSDAEWAMVLSHRSRSTGTARKASASKPRASKTAAGTAAAKAKAKPAASVKSVAKAKPTATAKPASTAKTKAKAKPAASAAVKAKPAAAAAKAKASSGAARNPLRKTKTGSQGGSSVAKRMAKAVSRLNASTSGSGAAPAPSLNGSSVPALV